MNFALQRSIEVLIIIVIGILLQKKITRKELKGVKVLLLSVAAPATIFIGILKIEMSSTVLFFPLLALCFNLLMFLISKYVLSMDIIIQGSAKKRTLMMLLPSLAPPLSCFPLLIIYAGEEILSLAVIAELGNKLFGLVLLFLLSRHWYHKRSSKRSDPSTYSTLKSLGMSLVKEPINIAIISGLIILSVGLKLTSLPVFFQNTLFSMKGLMAPLALLFIGMALRINAGEFGRILSMLVFRAGIVFCLSGAFVFFVPNLAPAMIILLVVFPQSSCSFWPYAHMSSISSLEEKDGQKDPTFDINFAVNILACSLPFSTFLIIGIFSFSDFFITDTNLLLSGIAMVFISFVPAFFRKLKVAREEQF